MNKRFYYIIAALLPVAVLVSLAGCARTLPSRFYLLYSEADTTSRKAKSDIAVGIAPVELPEYLNRPQIVTRRDSNEIQIAEFDRWAESLDHNVARVLAQNLSALLGSDRIFIYPWDKSTRIDYRLAVDITRFEGTLGGPVTLHTRWTICKETGEDIPMIRQSRYTRSSGDRSYKALVQAESFLIEQFSRDIAAAIQKR